MARRLWIMIADGEHARVVVPAPKLAFHTHHTLESSTAHLKTAELGRDRPPRTMESATGTRHAITPKHDPRELRKQKFAKEVAGEIERILAEEDLDGMLLAAPARALDEILGELDARTSAKIVGTLKKDLTKVPDHELAPHLEAWFPESRARSEEDPWRR